MENRLAYIALCTLCKGITAVLACHTEFDRRRANAAALYKAVLAGDVIQTMNDDWIRTYSHGLCKCHWEK